MAFIENPDEEEQKQKALLAPELDGAGGAPVDVGGGGAKAPLQSPETSGKGGFVDVNAYLDANKEQAQGMGDTVAGKIGQEGTQFKGGVDTELQNFQGQVDQNRNRVDSGLVNETIADPTKIAADAAKMAQFQKMRSGVYAGPTDAFGGGKYEELSSKAKDLSTKYGNVTGKEAIKNLLYSTGKNPTLGQVELDQLLLAGDPTARGKIEGAAGQFKDIGSYLDQAKTKGTGYVADAEAEAAKAGEETRRVDKYGEDFTGGIRTRAEEANKAAALLPEQRQKLTNLFNTLSATGKANLSQQDRDFLQGVIGNRSIDALEGSLDFEPFNSNLPPVQRTDSRWNDTFTRDEVFNKGNDPTETGANPWNISTKEDVARMRALESLLGSDYGISGAESDIGTYQPGTISTVAQKAPSYDFANIFPAKLVDMEETNTIPFVNALKAAGVNATEIPGESYDDRVKRILGEYLAKRNQFWS